MSLSANKLLEEALKLSEDARADLAAALIESLDDERDPNVESAWSDEIARRLQDYESGAVKPIPWNEARKMIFGQRDAGVSLR
jgi:putative addiction module component (TIGR02574 family)